jgi:hypothetical protein
MAGKRVRPNDSTANGTLTIGSKTKSIFSVVRADDSVFAHETQSYDGKDELN